MRAKAFVAVVLLIAVLPLLHAKSKVPDWLNDIIDFGDAYERIEPDADSLVLWDTLSAEYLGGGNVSSYAQFAIHLKSRSKRELAKTYIPLYNKAQTLKSFKAWLIYPSGKIETFGKKDGFMQARELDALSSEGMAFILDRSYSVHMDDVIFAYEYKVSEKTKFLQEMWHFQTSSPVLYSSFRVKVPGGWKAKGTIFNSHDAVHSSAKGDEYKWDARDLPSIDLEEVYRLPHRQLLAQVGVSIVPPENQTKEDTRFCFDSWNDVSKFGYDTFRIRTEPTKEIVEKTNSLVLGAKSDWEKIKAIGEYAQTVNYMQINIDVNAGGGYEPHSASIIFDRHFGDCKDMTALAISMMRTQDIEAYPVSASIGEESYVYEEWPSPYHFDHCIVAIPVSDEVEGTAVIRDPSLGKVLIFDPTSQYTPIGTLPGSLSGTKILIEDGNSDALISLPVQRSSQATALREIDVTLDINGNLSGTIRETTLGNLAVYNRYLKRSINEKDYEDIMQKWISSGTRNVHVVSITCEDSFDENRFVLEIQFESKFYGRVLSKKSMMFKPVFLGRREWVPPAEEERKSDYVVRPYEIIERSRFSLPDNVLLKEAPERFEAQSDFANYSLASNVEEGVVAVERKWMWNYAVLPVDRYHEVVDFYEQVTRADGRPFVVGME